MPGAFGGPSYGFGGRGGPPVVFPVAQQGFCPPAAPMQFQQPQQVQFQLPQQRRGHQQGVVCLWCNATPANKVYAETADAGVADVASTVVILGFIMFMYP